MISDTSRQRSVAYRDVDMTESADDTADYQERKQVCERHTHLMNRLLLSNTACALILLLGGIISASIAQNVYGGKLETTLGWVFMHFAVAATLLCLCWLMNKPELVILREIVVAFGPLVVCLVQFVVTILYAAQAAGYMNFDKFSSSGS